MNASGEDAQRNRQLDEALLSFAGKREIDTGLIARLRGECELFREICADYEECCGKLLSLEQTGAAAGRQLHDYREMRDQLERDLRRCLEDPSACGKCWRRVDQT